MTTIINVATVSSGIVPGITSSRQNESVYGNATITAINGNTFSVTYSTWYLNGTPLPAIRSSIEFNSTNADIFDYLDSSQSYLNTDNFTLGLSQGNYTIEGFSYPAQSVIASNGSFYSSAGNYWWFSNQTVIYGLYSGIMFYSAFNTTVFYYTANAVPLLIQTVYMNGTSVLNATNVSLSPPAGGGNISILYLEIGVAALAVAAAGIALYIMKKRGKIT